MGMNQHILKLAVLALLFAGPGWAGTTITDTVYGADGRLWNGRVVIQWNEFATGTRTIAAGDREVRVRQGAFTTELEPNDTAAPAGTSYRATYLPDVGSRTLPVERWVVPT